MAEEHTCPKCRGRMEEGYVPDWTNSQILQSRWFPGQPEPGLWGLKGVSGSEKGIPVTAYRCAECGYLEAYATRI
jgi:Domain of unknown function (DUF6487)